VNWCLTVPCVGQLGGWGSGGKDSSSCCTSLRVSDEVNSLPVCRAISL